MKTLTSAIIILLFTMVMVLSMYATFAFSVFQFRNPTANNMSFWRDFAAVMSFQKLDKYQ